MADASMGATVRNSVAVESRTGVASERPRRGEAPATTKRRAVCTPLCYADEATVRTVARSLRTAAKAPSISRERDHVPFVGITGEVLKPHFFTLSCHIERHGIRSAAASVDFEKL